MTPAQSAPCFASWVSDVVEAKFDLGIADLRRVLRDFLDMAQEADVAVVYYAGHGMEVNSTNYLVPVDATLARDVDVEDETVSLDRIEPAKRVQLVILIARPEISNRSLNQLLTGKLPLHPPIEGLPEQLWNLGCSACHNWDKTTLCAPGNVYAKHPRMITRLPHTFGTPFKVAVRDWAKNACK
jgi:hypothetical protein